MGNTFTFKRYEGPTLKDFFEDVEKLYDKGVFTEETTPTEIGDYFGQRVKISETECKAD